MKVSIHQPGYLPWLPFFRKIAEADTFVFLDDVQYEKNGWQNRNKIKINGENSWITVPVHANIDMKLNEIKVIQNTDWRTKHCKTFEINYSKAKFFQEYWKEVEKIYQKNHEFLIELNIDLIKFVLKKIGITKKIIKSSELNIQEKGSKRILGICKALDADSYISGMGLSGKKYLEITDFEQNNIKMEFHNFKYQKYEQIGDKFVPNLSIIDLLFNEGSNSKKILLTSKI